MDEAVRTNVREATAENWQAGATRGVKGRRGSTPMDWSNLDEALTEAAVPYVEGQAAPTGKQFVFPGAVLLVGRAGEVVYHKAFGSRSLEPEPSPMNKDTVFDVASLTKAIVTTTLVMQAVDHGQLTLDRRLSHIFQSFSTHGKERITVRHLLSHSSGLPAYVPFYRHIVKAHSGERTGIIASRGAVESIYNEIFRGKLENLPGKVAKYSDVGFILLGAVLEVISGGATIDRLAQRHVFGPLGMSSSGYVELGTLKARGLQPATDIIAPTANCSWRGRVMCGEVHDDNAWVMGGVAGHAGLFSTAMDIHKFATEMINCWAGRGSLISQKTMKAFWARDEAVPNSTWALGWDIPSPQGSSAGRHFSRNSFGHLGYTGCSMWIDADREIDVIFLTNRVHPSPENNAIREFRPIVHDLVMEKLA